MQLYETARLDAITDGIAAVALTLLVIDIGLPEDVTAQTLPMAMVHLGRRIELWLVSVAVVGLLWFLHQNVFDRQKQMDGMSIGFWLAFLAGLSLLPFSVTVVADFPEVPLAWQSFWFNVFVTSAATVAQFVRVVSLPNAHPDFSDPQLTRRFWIALTAPLVASCLCMGLAMIHGRASLWGWTLVMIAALVVDGWRRRRS